MMPVRRSNQTWLPSIFNDFFDNDWMVKANATAPAINVIESDKDYKVEVAAPGMTKEDFKIHINEDNDLAFRERVDARIEAGVRKEKAIYEELKSMIRSSRAIRFDGNGYSEEWRAEAARRGLDCETCAPRVFDRYLDPSSSPIKIYLL